LLRGLKLRLAVFLAAAAAAPLYAKPLNGTLGGATVILQIGTQLSTQLLSVTPRVEGNQLVYDFDNSFNLAGGTGIEITGTLNADPWISWTVNAVNFEQTPVSFLAEVDFAINGGPFSSITSSLGGSITDLDGDGAFAFGLANQTLLNLNHVAALDLGSSSTCETGSGPPVTTFQCESFGPASAPLSASYAELGTQTAFTLSNRDTATFSGSATLETPEPSAAALMLVGLAGFASRWVRPQGPLIGTSRDARTSGH
jgi:hypothetical protein